MRVGQNVSGRESKLKRRALVWSQINKINLVILYRLGEINNMTVMGKQNNLLSLARRREQSKHRECTAFVKTRQQVVSDKRHRFGGAAFQQGETQRR